MACRLTHPVPYSNCTLAVNVVLCPTFTVCESGVIEPVKSVKSVPAGPTFNTIVLLWALPPPVAVMTKGYVAVGVELAVVTDSTVHPEPPVTTVGLNAAVAPAGSPLTLMLTSLVNPLSGIICILRLPVPPGVVVVYVDCSDPVKSAKFVPEGPTFNATAPAWTKLPLVPVSVIE